MADIQMEGEPKPRHESTILAVPQSAFTGFVEFLRERGVAGFAIGFIFGGAAQTFVKSLMDDIINPLVGLFIGPVGSASEYTIGVIRIGSFFSALINFLILCFVMYLIFKVLHLEKLDKPKE
jgi:large conductance mechanosensitive channel